jgi:hypothetical protein
MQCSSFSLPVKAISSASMGRHCQKSPITGTVENRDAGWFARTRVYLQFRICPVARIEATTQHPVTNTEALVLHIAGRLRRKSPYSRSLDDSIAPQCALNSPGVGGTAKAGSRVHISRSTRSVSAEKVRRCHTEAVMRDSFASQNGASYLTVIPYHLRAAAGVFPIQRGGSIMRLLRCSLHCVGGGRAYRDPRVLHFGCQVGS